MTHHQVPDVRWLSGSGCHLNYEVAFIIWGLGGDTSPGTRCEVAKW